MAAVTATILSERETGQVVLRAAESNIDGAVGTLVSLPAGFGDCYIIRAAVTVQDVATMMTTPELSGPRVYLATPAGASHDVFWSSRWDLVPTGGVTALIQPQIAVLWRDSEVFTVDAREVDTNAAPTADVTVWILVHRRRNMGPEETVSGPLRFTS